MGRKFIILFALTAVLAFLPIRAMAGFKATPIKIYFDARTKTAALNVVNDGDDKTTIQIEAMEWSQDENGNDQYAPASDLIFFPKIVTMEKGEERIVRVGYEGKPGDREKTYRLFLQELPVPKEGEAAVNIALRMGLPVFVKPVKESRASRIEGLGIAEGALAVKVKNDGNSHIIVSNIRAEGIGQGETGVFLKEIGGWYTLAGGSKTYKIDIPKDECIKTGEIKVRVTVDGTVMEKKLMVDSSRCADKP